MIDRVWLRIMLRELTANRSRTALTVLSIAVGLFAVSLTFRTQAILSRNVLDVYRTSEPAAVVVQVLPTDPQLTAAIRRVAGVRAVEAVNHISARVRVGETWRALALIGIEDMPQMEVNRLTLDTGVWPGARQAILIERSFAGAGGLQVGAPMLIELDGGDRRSLPLIGAAHDLTVISGRLGNPVLQGYVSLATAERLTGVYAVNEFQIAVIDDERGVEQLRAVADRVEAALRDAGCTVLSVRVRDPSAPDTYAIIAAVFQLLIALGLLSLMLSACLVINTTAAMVARHVAQIGVMKAVGARSRTIFGVYFGMVLIVALAALVVALPAGALGAWLLAQQLAWLLNYDVLEGGVPAGVVALEVMAGVVTPLLASAYPIGVTARITVREALSEGRGGSPGALSRLSVPLPGVPISLLYAARSMFRRKSRLALTLAALAVGGAIEITVASTQASLTATLAQVADYWQQDLTVSLSQPAPSARMVGELLGVPGVVSAEPQPAALAVRRRPAGADSEDRYAIYGVQPGSALLEPTLVGGRWLSPNDTDAIVVNVDLLRREPGLALGDWVELRTEGRSSRWQIVGVVTTHLLIYGDSSIGQGVGYITAGAFTQMIYQAQQTNRLVIVTARHDAAARAEIGRAIEARFAQIGLQALVQTHSDIEGQISGFVSLLVLLLTVMGLAFVVIGVLSLVGAMSLNVLERTKEVGVLRAIGSAHRQIASMVVAEGICVGVLSWIPAMLLALPLSRVLSDLIGRSMLSWPLVYVFPLAAPLIWLAAVALLAAGSSYLPARRAAAINVRAALEHL